MSEKIQWVILVVSLMTQLLVNILLLEIFEKFELKEKPIYQWYRIQIVKLYKKVNQNTPMKILLMSSMKYQHADSRPAIPPSNKSPRFGNPIMNPIFLS